MFKQVTVGLLCFCLFTLSWASEMPVNYHLSVITEKRLEELTRGGVIKQRFTSKSIRILCEDAEATQNHLCLRHAFYVVKGQKKSLYKLEKIGDNGVSFTWEDVALLIGKAAHYNRTPLTVYSFDIYIFLLAIPYLFLLYGPVGVANNVRYEFKNLRIKNVNDRLQRLQQQIIQGRAKDIKLDGKKYCLVESTLRSLLAQ